MTNSAMPTVGGTSAMANVEPMHSAVKSRRNGIRRPPRSEIAPRIGDTTALSPTLSATDTPSKTPPSRGPNWLFRYSPIAPDTTAKLKMVFAKSYKDQAAGTIARPLGVRAARPRARDAGTGDEVALATG